MTEKAVLSSEARTPIGRMCWALAEGYLPEWSNGPAPEMESHETLCFLNASDIDAEVSLRIYFSDREPVGPYHVQVPARRTKHLRLTALDDPEPLPRGKEYAAVVESNTPIVVQQTRLDSRQAENALLSTIAFPG
ncbi:MAG: hypothetical protein KDD69_00995 [Bdellovibrionales bacterium]|nr:hypothetical protein [Bdellovibrionales bacterium]